MYGCIDINTHKYIYIHICYLIGNTWFSTQLTNVHLQLPLAAYEVNDQIELKYMYKFII